MRIRSNLVSLPTRLRLATSLLLRRSRLHWGMDPWLDIRTLLHGMGRPLDRRSVVFDVGANLGQTARAVRRWLPSVDLHCYEPFPSTFRRLQAARPRASLHQVGLSRRSGSATMDQGAHHMCARIVAEAASAAEGHGPPVEVPVRTVDEELGRLGLPRLEALKIDVEGHELDVLHGAEAAIRDDRIDLVLAECRIGASGSLTQHVPIEALVAHLEPRGFRAMAYYTGAIAADRGVHDGDVLMARIDRLDPGMYWGPCDVLSGDGIPFSD